MVTLTKEQVQEILEASMPDLKKAVVEEMKSHIGWEAREEAMKLVSEAITAFVASEIVPEIKAQLEASKDGLVATGVAAAPMLVEEIAKALCTSVKEKMENSYRRGEVFKALFT
jgi:uncharacterized protein with von Willebrand factor type A (vWA) domain